VHYSDARSLQVADSFRHVMSLSPTPVTIVTAAAPAGPEGIVIGSFVSVSLEPPLVGFFVGTGTRMWQPMADASAYCINVLSEDQTRLSERFTRFDVDRFADIGWEPGGNGAPALAGVVAWIEATPFSVSDAGDHELVLLEVGGLRQGTEKGPLVYHLGQYAAVSPGP